MSRSTYYYQLKRLDLPDKYAKAKEHIKRIFERNKGRYGYRRVHIVLRQQGIALNHKTIQRLMNMMGLQGKQRRNKYRSYKGTAMSRKGNCLYSVMENFFGEIFVSVEDFKQKLEEYICYFNNERVSLALKGMSPVQYRPHST